ncbi:hypothetical protein PFLUV_G00097340 [Perca fluviatilis]|uniref:Uncharacterized protein n=1 Tax=Perca fluviatilis TaxID=8168 RepID=A0A6A5EX04_PERFL|nr:hypothetical protein PFLUV_G00097340 [Perca fluviatilis]
MFNRPTADPSPGAQLRRRRLKHSERMGPYCRAETRHLPDGVCACGRVLVFCSLLRPHLHHKMTSDSEVTSLCTSTTALAFQHGSRTAAQQSSVLLKSQRGPDQSRAGCEPGSRPSQPRQLGAAYNKWETMRTSTPPTLCM